VAGEFSNGRSSPRQSKPAGGVESACRGGKGSGGFGTLKTYRRKGARNRNHEKKTPLTSKEKKKLKKNPKLDRAREKIANLLLSVPRSLSGRTRRFHALPCP